VATNNFKVFNENFSNVQSDAVYLADAQRLGGVVPGVAPSALHNKMYRQATIMAAALGQVIANRGYNASDADLAALVTALSSAFSPFATSANVTYYVDPAGSDANNGLSAGAAGAFKTIGKAISMIPQIVNHTVTINVAQGTYAEDISLIGFIGKGSITINGAASVLSDLYVANSITIIQCTCLVIATGLKFIITTGSGAFIVRSIDTRISYCRINTAASQPGVSCSSTNNAGITNCEISNRSNGINADGSSTVFSNTNTGTGNTIGLVSNSNASIGKNSTQPAGTTAESVSGGGVIR
jgi:hypothetical protein